MLERLKSLPRGEKRIWGRRALIALFVYKTEEAYKQIFSISVVLNFHGQGIWEE